MGVPIHLFETLLLLSNKKLVVKFLFHNNCDFSFIKASCIHLVFDATGGRFFGEDAPCTDIATLVGPTLSQKNIKNFGADCISAGISKSVTLPQYDLSTQKVGENILPLYQGEVTKAAMLKLTHIPFELYSEILSYVQTNNADARFFVWAGTLKKEINQVLLIINLLKEEYEFFANTATQTMNLSSYLSESSLPASLDDRIANLFQFLLQRTPANDAIQLEPPFISAPYLRPYGDSFATLHQKPLVRVGDSIYNGNPKFGNGLGQHLIHVRRIHDLFLEAFKGKS